MQLHRKIIKGVFSVVEIARAHQPGAAVYDIVMSPCDEWLPSLRRFTRYTPHRITYAPLAQTDLSRFDMAVPLNLADVLYLADHAHLTRGHVLSHPNRAAVELLHDKARFDTFLRDLGLAPFLPPAATIGDPSAIEFPAILKPRTGEFGRDCHLLRVAQDLTPHRHLLQGGTHLLQHFIPGDREYAIHLYVHDRRIVCSLGIEYIFAHDHPVKGVDSPIAQGLYRCPFLSQWLSILNAADFEGLCCVNYKLTPDGRPMLFEINPRFGGSLAPLFFTFLRHLKPARRPVAVSTRHTPTPAAHSSQIA
jgi:hypothetical protein